MMNSFGFSTTRFVVAFLLAGGMVAGSAQSGQTLKALTVPAAALPSGCALQPLPTNPWSGTERKIVAEVGKAIDATPRVVPDGPPLDVRAAAAFELKWADNVLEAYHAAYSSANGSKVEVFAVTFNDAKLATPEPLWEMVRRRRGPTSRIVWGATVIRVSAPTPTECFEVVRAYIESLK